MVVVGGNRETVHFKISETVGKICVATNVNNYSVFINTVTSLKLKFVCMNGYK